MFIHKINISKIDPPSPQSAILDISILWSRKRTVSFTWKKTFNLARLFTRHLIWTVRSDSPKWPRLLNLFATKNKKVLATLSPKLFWKSVKMLFCKINKKTKYVIHFVVFVNFLGKICIRFYKICLMLNSFIQLLIANLI